MDGGEKDIHFYTLWLLAQMQLSLLGKTCRADGFKREAVPIKLDGDHSAPPRAWLPGYCF